MKKTDTTDHESGATRHPPVDRLLLVAILVVQLLILWRTGSRPKEGVDPNPPETLQSSQVAHQQPGPPIGVVPPRPLEPEQVFLHPSALLLENHMEHMMVDALAQFEQIERLLSEDATWSALPPSPTMEMRDEEDSYVVLFSLPHADPAGIRVTLEGRLLTVANQSRRAARTGRGAFERRIWLPGPVRTDDYATAVLTNGVLKVTILKETGPRVEARPPGAA